MRYPIYQINAFSQSPFGGNSACVVPLTSWLPEELMLAIAKQNAVAETAFFIEQGTSVALRWFTPDIEIDLCGHATLAAAHCLIEHRNYTTQPIHFTTQSGSLYVSYGQGRYQLDLPARPGAVSELPEVITQALSIQPKEVYKARDYLLVYDTQAEIESLRIARPVFDQINLGPGGMIVTAPGDTHDFVSRFFTPQATILEDPVTGSAHCTLVPYWAKRLNKSTLHAHQCSARGGELWCEDQGKRVLVSGLAQTFSAGTFSIADSL
ncbi:MAG: PhzF family phenazine biosynthesis protein [Flavobacteriaceae bacterium]|nr:PhzF family phenazine biosynthesis protein [Flavobacteriaceae bacterium]